MSVTIERTTHSEQETMQLASSLATHLRGRELITLDGPLGSGKTCFVRGLAQGLGVAPSEVSSPTFVLVHEYQATGSRRLIHIDAYRMTGEAELDTIGWEEYLSVADSIVVIEWPSRIARSLQDCARIEIMFEYLSEHERALTISATDALVNRVEPLRDETTKTI